MKRMKIAFLAIIAVIAMSFTISDNLGIFKSVNPPVEELCFQSIKVEPTSCTLPDELYRFNVEACPDDEEPGTSLIENYPVIDASNPFDYDGEEPEECPGDSKFCCAVLKVGNQICNQPALDLDGIPGNPQYYRVDLVFCYTPE